MRTLIQGSSARRHGRGLWQEKTMRGLFWGAAVLLALTGAAEARDCSGQGSARVLTLEHWLLVPDGSGAVELTYRLNEDKLATLVAAHVYFEVDSDSVPADAALELVDAAGLAPGGTAVLTVTNGTPAGGRDARKRHGIRLHQLYRVSRRQWRHYRLNEAGYSALVCRA
jgi:hypothetical protein